MSKNKAILGAVALILVITGLFGLRALESAEKVAEALTECRRNLAICEGGIGDTTLHQECREIVLTHNKACIDALKPM